MRKLILVFLILFSINLNLVNLVYAQNKTIIYFFWRPGCPYCAAEKTFLEEMSKKYPELEVKYFDITIEENAQLFRKMCKAYGTDPLGVPMTFIGEKYVLGYGGYEKSGKQIQQAIVDCIHRGCIDPITKITQEETREVPIAQIMSLAVADSINPCELAILVGIMTAILTRSPGEKQKALKAGLAFSSAIFIVYLIFGLLIITGFKFVAGFAQLDRIWFYQFLAIIVIILGLLNLKDAIWHGRGFGMEIPMRWRPRVKEIVGGATSVGGAFIVGLMVSFFLTPCTGGPYFVAGGILSSVSLLSAIPYLLLYMMIFISPMIAITLIVYFGFMAVEDISGWRKRNVKTLHWITGLVLLGLGASMILGLI